MININMLRRVALVSSAWLAFGAGAETLTLSCGSLENEIYGLGRQKPSSLVLKGEATAYDLTSLRNLPSSVAVLDMSDLEVKGCTAPKVYYGIREFADGELPAYMLTGTSVEEVILPSGAVSVGEGAFAGTPVASVDLRNVKSLGAHLFKGCARLSEVKTGAVTATSIPEGAFRDCGSLSALTLPAGVTEIADRAFQNSGLTAMDLGNVMAIGDYAFAQCGNLSEITLNSRCVVGEGAFYGDSGLGASGVMGFTSPLAFANAGNAEAELRVDAPVVKEGAFASNNASKIIMGMAVASIESNAFAGMTNVRSVDVGALGTATPQIAADAFYNVDTPKVELWVAPSTADHWKTEPVWNEFDIQEKTAGGDDVGTGICEISVSKTGGSIFVNSGDTIHELSVYTLDGALLSECNPDSESYTFDMPDSPEVLLVRVKSGDMIKVVKIIR